MKNTKRNGFLVKCLLPRDVTHMIEAAFFSLTTNRMHHACIGELNLVTVMCACAKNIKV